MQTYAVMATDRHGAARWCVRPQPKAGSTNADVAWAVYQIAVDTSFAIGITRIGLYVDGKDGAMHLIAHQDNMEGLI